MSAHFDQYLAHHLRVRLHARFVGIGKYGRIEHQQNTIERLARTFTNQLVAKLLQHRGITPRTHQLRFRLDEYRLVRHPIRAKWRRRCMG